METFDNPDDLIRRLATAAEEIIAVDGFTDAGKSTLARAIAASTGRTHIDLDSFRPKGADAYVPELDLAALAEAIGSAETSVVSGICLRHAFEQGGISAPARHVYVKECHHGYWCREDEADGVTALMLKFDARFPPSTVTHEMRAYHEKWQPHRKADHIYLREKAPDLQQTQK